MNRRMYSENAQQLSTFKDIFIRHPDVQFAWDGLVDIYDSGALAQGAECICLTGPSRAGKSQTLERFADQMNGQDEPDATPSEDPSSIRMKPLRVAVVETPSRATLKTLTEATLIALKDPAPSKGSYPSMLLRACALLRDRGTRVLVFDEFQHLVSRETRSVHLDNPAADFVKSILNSGACAVVLSGMPEVEEIVARDTQLTLRCGPSIRMRPLGFATSAERKLFLSCLSQFERAVPLPEAFKLTTPEMGQRIHCATEGLLGSVVHLLTISVRIAKREGLPSLSESLLAETFSSTLMARRFESNPFTVPLAGLPVPSDARDRQTAQQRRTRREPRTVKDVLLREVA